MMEQARRQPTLRMGQTRELPAARSLQTLVFLSTMIFRQSLTYRMEWLFGVFQSVLFLWVEVTVWQTLLGGSTGSNADSVVTAADMVTYLVVASVVRALVQAGIAEDMEARLRTGDIVNDLLRPVGFPVLVIGRSLGSAGASLLSRTLPTVILAYFVWGLKSPASWQGAVAVLGAVLIGVAIAYAINCLLGILGFWVWTTDHFVWLVGAFIRVLSGAAIPFWFLPDWLRAVGEALPFHTMGYTPVGLYLGKIPPSEAWFLMVAGLAWAVGLWGLVWLCWRRAISRIVVQGG
jgi:ABC-2 type transport system permease protein